jgi:L-lysine exporter family protein LysE/ArgO
LIPVFIKGLLLGASLIIAIGLQNAFVLRQGLKKKHVLVTALTASLCDAALITAGVLGFGAIVHSLPSLLEAIRWMGAIFLFAYGLKSFRAAFKTGALDQDAAQGMAGGVSVRRVVLVLLGVSLLNPHVYLDTVVLLGGLSAAYPGAERYLFGAGAMTASFLWFFSLAYGARFLAPLFEKPRAWQILDSIIGLVMWGIAFSLIWEELAGVWS